MANDRNKHKKQFEFEAKRFDELMKEQGLSNGDMAELLNYDSNHISRLRNGVYGIKEDRRKILIETFNLEPDYFEEPKTEAEKYRAELLQVLNVKGHDKESTVAVIQLLRVIDPDFDVVFPALTSKMIRKKINTQYQTELTPQLQMVDDFKALITELWSHVKEPLSNRSDLDFVMSCQLSQESKELETTFYQKHPQEPNSDYAMLYQLNKENLHYECFPYIKDSKDPTIKVEVVETVTVPKEELQKHKGKETNFRPVSEETKSKDMEQ